MTQVIHSLFSELQKTIETLPIDQITEERKKTLQPFINYISDQYRNGKEVNLNFICTHNSRRSQFSQLWAETASSYYNIPAKNMSGGVEVTAFNERAVASVVRMGFKVSSTEGNNPVYSVSHSEDRAPISMFSKLFDAPENKVSQFAAIMTCSDADENCPFIPGTEQRIPVRYKDPKDYDDTDQEADQYDNRSLQIGAEMFYAFSQVTK